MSYLMERRRRQHRARNGAQLSGLGFWDPIQWLADSSPIQAIAGVLDPKSADYANQAACLAKADQATQNIDSVWQQIAQQWNPSGNFAVGDLNTASSAVYQMLEEAKIAVILAPNTVSDRNTMVNQALDDITKYENQGIPFQQAVVQAQAQSIQYIHADGFKDWVLKSLVAASAAFATRSVLDCNTSWLETAWQYILGVRDKVLAIAYEAVDFAIDAGAAVINTASTAFSLLSYAKWGALLLGGLYLYTRYYAPAHTATK